MTTSILMPTDFGRCLVCDEPVTEERYWAAKSRTGVAPKTCGPKHQMLLAVRRSRGLDEKGRKIDSPSRRRRGSGGQRGG
jgi:hypothetical protein